MQRKQHGPSWTLPAATGRHRLWSTVRPANAASLRVLEKIGFRRDHVTTDDRGDVVYLVRDLQAPVQSDDRR